MGSRLKIFSGVMIASASKAQAAGFPQLDPTWYGNQLLWLVISFGLLYALVSTFITPTINGVLKTRSTAIDEAIREAERAQQAAESTKSHIQSENSDARSKASAYLAKAQSETSANSTEALAKLDQELARKTKKAELLIDESKAKALQAINASTVDLATAMASKLLGRSIDAQAVQPIVTTLLNAK